MLLVQLAACTNNDDAAVNNSLLPAWLIGEYNSKLKPSENHIIIKSEGIFIIDLSAFDNERQYIFSLNDVTTVSEPRYFSIKNYNGLDITFRRLDDPSKNDIKIEIFDNGQLYEYGWFEKLNQ